MRVALVVTVAALSMVCVTGCGSSSSTTKFCSPLTSTKLDFAAVADRDKELATLDRVIAQLPPSDRKLVTPVRDYARILYGRSSLSEAQKLTFLAHFFHVDAPTLDRRLRKECDVPLDKHIASFANLSKGGGS